MKITGLVVWTLDNTLSVKFYKKLGFTVMESTEQISVVALRDFTITLVSMRDQQEFNRDSLAAEKGRGMYVYVRTNDRDATFTQLHKRGVNTTTPPRNWEWGNREFVVKDPDGYKICFWQPTNEER